VCVCVNSGWIEALNCGLRSFSLGFWRALKPSGDRQRCPGLKWLLARLLSALQEETGARCSCCPGKWIAGDMDIERCVLLQPTRISILSPCFTWCLFGSYALPFASLGICTPLAYALMRKTTQMSTPLENIGLIYDRKCPLDRVFCLLVCSSAVKSSTSRSNERQVYIAGVCGSIRRKCFIGLYENHLFCPTNQQVALPVQFKNLFIL
jgi:hypothetical protein